MRRLLSILSAFILTIGLASMLSAPVQAAEAQAVQPTAKVKKVPAKRLLKRLAVDKERRAWAYDRDDWDHWVIKKGKCDTRETVLAHESKKKVKKRSDCSVKSGKWKSEYTGRVVRKARNLDIDHRVALAEAWRSGGHKWNANKRRGFANDIKYKHALLAVDASSNRSKSDRDPADWMPSKKKCPYVARWIAVKYRWKLSVDPAEKSALTSWLSACPKSKTMVEKPAKGKPEKKKKKKSGGGGGGGDSVPPISSYDCPSSHPVKGNQSGIYHVPGGRYYNQTSPEECFASAAAAEKAGYRASRGG